MQRIKTVRFELSGHCSMRYQHSHICPCNSIPQATLPTEIIFKVARELPKYFSGDVGFHNYNDPMVDPRIYYIVNEFKKILPDCCISIWSNGLYLDKLLVKIGIKLGVDKFIITPYTTRVYKELKDTDGVIFNGINFDDRMKIYDKTNNLCKHQCDSPLGNLLINRFGNISLCCYDWKNTVSFGNLHNCTLKDCLPKMEEVYNQLKYGDRRLEVCSKCRWTRKRYEDTQI